MEKLETEIIVLICKLEKIFPPGFHRNAASVVGDMMYYARIQVISQAMFGSEGRRLESKNEATQYGLDMTEQQYLEVMDVFACVEKISIASRYYSYL
jgi:hypothetical protein